MPCWPECRKAPYRPQQPTVNNEKRSQAEPGVFEEWDTIVSFIT
jgi:hypothetical protein